jgi:two-component system KDP operon response regulator KdpE
MAESHSPEIVLLDLGLPDADGKEIIPMLRRERELAVIIISARHQEAEKVAALDAGADDYVDKPFNIDELAARMRAAERRLNANAQPRESYSVGDLALNVATREVRLGDRPVKLSRKEFELLRELVAHAGQVVTHKRLLLSGWGDPNVDPQYLRGYIASLRQKLESDPAEPELIVSEPGVGYRLAI